MQNLKCKMKAGAKRFWTFDLRLWTFDVSEKLKWQGARNAERSWNVVCFVQNEASRRSSESRLGENES